MITLCKEIILSENLCVVYLKSQDFQGKLADVG